MAIPAEPFGRISRSFRHAQVAGSGTKGRSVAKRCIRQVDDELYLPHTPRADVAPST